MTGEVLIIGIGNPIRGDDALGWKAARSLETLRRENRLDADILVVQQLTMDLVEEVSRAKLVVFIDAEIGDHPGQVKQKEILDGTSLSGPGAHLEEKHYIEWVEVIDAQGKAYRQFLNPGETPEATFCLKGAVTAREYCNIHGLWKA